MSLLASALHYAENGIPVFPVHGINVQGHCTCLSPTCPHPGKHPIFKGGFAIATTNPEQISAWWKKHPEANIGVPTGALSGWYVVDIAAKNGIENYRQFSKQNSVPSATLKVITGGGGIHLIYGQPADSQSVSSGTNIGRLQGVNFRGDEGYIVVPPSRHHSKNNYRWHNSFTFQGHTDLAQLEPLPAIIVDLVNKPLLSDIQSTRGSVGKGGRNAYLFQQACQYRKNGMADTGLLDTVWAENQFACYPPLDWAEVEKLVANVLNMDISPQQSKIRSLIPRNAQNRAAASGQVQPKDKKDKEKIDDPFDRLMLLTKGHEFWLDEAKKQFVTHPVANKPVNNSTNQPGQTSAWHYENWPIMSSNYGDLLAYQYRQRYQEPVSNSVLDSVLQTLAGDTLFEGKTYKTHVRTARDDQDRIFIDLTDDNWNCVGISASGWSVFSGNPPVKFLRKNTVQPMPIPDPSGDFSSLRDMFRLGSEEDYILLAAWLTYALVENGPYPILVLEGVAGVSKSTLTKQIRQLIDPRKPLVQGMPRHIGDLYLTANHAHLLALDNLSGIGQELSDTLCGIATGTGFSKRALYSDSDEVYYELCKPIVLNSVNPVIDFSDLADRSIRLNLPPITSNIVLENSLPQEPLPKPVQGRVSKQEVDEQFQNCAPKILGALFTAIQVALPQYRDVKNLPAEIRMIDFAQWGVAAGDSLTSGGLDFVNILMANRRHSSRPLLEDNVLNSALLKFMQRQKNWSGLPTELFYILRDNITDEELKQKTFPKLANQLTRELNKSITTLKQFGIDYCPADGRNHKDRTITLKYMPVSSDSVNGAVRDKTVEIIPAKAQDSVIDMKNEADIVSHSNNSAKDPFEVTAPIKSKRMPHSVRCRHSATGKERVRPRSLPDNNTGQFDEPSIQTD